MMINYIIKFKQCEVKKVYGVIGMAREIQPLPS